MKTVQDVCDRVRRLQSINAPYKNEQRRIRDIMDGGAAGLRALAGRQGSRDMDLLDSLPTGNPLLSGLTHLSQKLQQVPDLKVPAPEKKDDYKAVRHAERRERIVRSFDEACALEMQLPQVGLWLPGYGFSAWVITERRDGDGQPYPHPELRDPMEAFPGDWGVDQQPDEIAFMRTIPLNKLARMYPEHATSLMMHARGTGGAVLLGSGVPSTDDVSSWSTMSQGVQVAEYYDADGCWWVVPDRNILLEHIPNPLHGRPQFEVAKRFSFNKLQGQYDQVIGLLAMIAKLTVMQAQFIQDSVHTETNIFGTAPSQYRKGRFAINEMDASTRVEKPMNNMPFQAFQAVDRLDRQLRTTSRYPITDDGQSPNSFVTGAGLEELGSTMSLEVREYQTVIRRAVESLDSKRLEWLERRYPQRKYTLIGEYRGEPYSESYKPASAIAGNYRTRRKYGFMAGWDESRKLVGGLQLVAGEIISKETMRDNLDGLDEAATKVKEQIRAEKAEGVAMDTLMGMANQGDPSAMGAVIEMLPEGPMKEALSKFFIPEEEEAPVEEQAGLPEQPPGLEEAMAMLGGGGGGETSSLARMTAQGNVGGGVQVQGAF